LRKIDAFIEFFGTLFRNELRRSKLQGSDMHRGDLEQGVAAAARLLSIRGRVLPSTATRVNLLGHMADGAVVEGETEIVAYPQPIRRIFLRPEVVEPPLKVLAAIRRARAIILGPGSVYTSVIPPLLVAGIADAVAKSRAVKVYVCNVAPQRGETEGYTAADHVRAVADHGGNQHLFDYVLVHTDKTVRSHRQDRDACRVVVPHVEEIRAMGYIPISADVAAAGGEGHDPMLLAQTLIGLLPSCFSPRRLSSSILSPILDDTGSHTTLRSVAKEH
jgi:uncharacterized cofD-like protein